MQNKSKTLEKPQNHLLKMPFIRGCRTFPRTIVTLKKSLKFKAPFVALCDPVELKEYDIRDLDWKGFRLSTLSRHPVRIKYMENQDAPQALKPSHHAGPQEYITSAVKQFGGI